MLRAINFLKKLIDKIWNESVSNGFSLQYFSFQLLQLFFQLISTESKYLSTASPYCWIGEGDLRVIWKSKRKNEKKSKQKQMRLIGTLGLVWLRLHPDPEYDWMSRWIVDKYRFLPVFIRTAQDM